MFSERAGEEARIAEREREGGAGEEEPERGEGGEHENWRGRGKRTSSTLTLPLRSASISTMSSAISWSDNGLSPLLVIICLNSSASSSPVPETSKKAKDSLIWSASVASSKATGSGGASGSSPTSATDARLIRSMVVTLGRWTQKREEGGHRVRHD